ncbi:hypothetical protein [uncultured Sphingomonas sp.]|uniref:hypothetical protein n=1 Tax=uncultured Sphingomonas sp. TaxID=158754 RepID=UPI00258A5840|nr:hypothetical protein [uncultured Sphingomonas sp.]
MTRAGPTCPGCGAAVPFRRTQWGWGKPFPCRRCGRQLVIPRSLSAIGTALFVPYWMLKGRADRMVQTAALVATLAAVALLLGWLLARAQVAPPD